MIDAPLVFTRSGECMTLQEWKQSGRSAQWARVLLHGSDFREFPRIAYHAQPFDPADYRMGKYHRKVPAGWASTDGGLHAYGLPARSEDNGEAEAARRAFAPIFDPGVTGLVWLATVPGYLKHRTHVVRVDLTKCDPYRLRFTGQMEGHLWHAGPVPGSAVTEET